jgi:hypothetical protein
MEPDFTSLVFVDIPRPDYADVAIMTVPEGVDGDPAKLARAVFAVASMPPPVRALFAVRQLAVRLIGVPPAPREIFAVSQVVGCEALIAADDVHLDFRAGVAVQDGLLRVTTAVRLKGWRGRVYFAPVRLAHPIITRAMMRSAIARMPR